MVDHAQVIDLPKSSPSPDHQKKKGLSNSIRDLYKIYKSLIKRWCHRQKPLTTDDDEETNCEAIDISGELHFGDKEGNMHGVHSHRYNGDGGGFYKHRSMDHCYPHVPSPLSRNSSRRRSPSPTPRSLSRDKSRKSPDLANGFFPESFSRSASRRGSTPIFYSNSTGMILKPPPIERNLECTLEELCYGCMKKIKITRDVVTNNRQLTQEEELLTIKVKPGWKKGTKITFEGMGNETPGTQPADVIFVITEKRHPLFIREGDDLELAVEIPLVKALTGCTIPIPLLGGEEMSLTIDDIISPGDEKIIAGQGMPNSKEQGKRGDLKVVFLIEFPAELTEEDRSEIVSILDDAVDR